VTAAGATGNVFTNNTVTGNGVEIPSGLVQSSAIVVRSGVASTVLDHNVVAPTTEPAFQVNDGSTARMTRNSFALNSYDHGGTAAATGQIGIDLAHRPTTSASVRRPSTRSTTPGTSTRAATGFSISRSWSGRPCSEAI
jgi:hypothetical protein